MNGHVQDILHTVERPVVKAEGVSAKFAVHHLATLSGTHWHAPNGEMIHWTAAKFRGGMTATRYEIYGEGDGRVHKVIAIMPDGEEREVQFLASSSSTKAPPPEPAPADLTETLDRLLGTRIAEIESTLNTMDARTRHIGRKVDGIAEWMTTPESNSKLDQMHRQINVIEEVVKKLYFKTFPETEIKMSVKVPDGVDLRRFIGNPNWPVKVNDEEKVVLDKFEPDSPAVSHIADQWRKAKAAEETKKTTVAVDTSAAPWVKRERGEWERPVEADQAELDRRVRKLVDEWEAELSERDRKNPASPLYQPIPHNRVKKLIDLISKPFGLLPSGAVKFADDKMSVEFTMTENNSAGNPGQYRYMLCLLKFDPDIGKFVRVALPNKAED